MKHYYFYYFRKFSNLYAHARGEECFYNPKRATDAIIACFLAYTSLRLASFLKCGSYIKAKKLYKERSSFSLPDVFLT